VTTTKATAAAASVFKAVQTATANGEVMHRGNKAYLAAFGKPTARDAKAVPYKPTPTPETVPAATAFQLSLTSLLLP